MQNKVLIVDDIADNINVAANLLFSESIDISFAQSGEEALKNLKIKTPDLILLDIMMPGMDGFEVCRRIKNNKNTKDIPVIFLTARDDKESIIKGFDLGAVDYITKPFFEAELIARVNTHLKIADQKKKIIENEKRLIKAQEVALMGNWEYDFINQKVYLSTQLTKIFETEEEILDFYELIETFFENTESKRFLSTIDSHFSGESRIYSEYKILLSDSNFKYIAVNSEAFFDSDKKIQKLFGTIQDITIKKIAELEIKESEERLSMIINSLQEGIFIVDPENKTIEDVNPAGIKMLNTKKGDLINNSCKNFICGISCEDCPLLSKNETFISKEVTLEIEDGKHITVLKTVIPITIKGRKLMLESLTDITERKKNEEEIRKLSTAIQQSPSTIVITDLDGVVEFTNPKFSELTGYTAEEAFGKNTSILNSGRTPKETFAELWETISKGETWRGEFINKKKNGKEFYEQAVIAPIKNAAGKTINYIAIKEDITSKKEIELKFEKLFEKNLETNKLLRQVINATDDLIFVKDTEDKHIMANKKYAQILNEKQTFILGKKDNELKNAFAMHGSLKDKGIFGLQKSKKKSKFIKETMQVKFPDNSEKTYQTQIIKMQNNEKKTFATLIFAHDITKQKQYEKQLRNLLIETNKSKDLLQTIIGATNDWIYARNKNGKFMFANKSFANAFNINSTQIINKTKNEIDNFFVTNEKGEKPLHLSKKEEEIFTTNERYISPEEFFILPDKTNLIFEIQKIPLTDEENKVFAVLTFAHDITKQKEYEDQIRSQLIETNKSKELLNAIINATNDWIYARNKTGKFLFANKSFAKAFKTDSNNIINKTKYEIDNFFVTNAVGEKPIHLSKKEEELFTTKEKFSSPEEFFTLPDKTNLIFEIDKIPLTDTSNDVFAVLTFAHDITRRALAEETLSKMNINLEKIVQERTERLKLSEHNFKNLFDKSNDAIIINKLNGDILAVNEAASIMLGYSDKELTRMNTKEIMSKKFETLKEKLYHKLKNGKQITFETNNITKPGKTIPVEISSTIIEYYGERVLLSAGRDITERIEAEKNKLQTIIKTEEKERSRFAKDLHDGLGATLSAIKMYINIVKRSDPNSEKAKKMLDEAIFLIDKAGKNAKEIAVNIRPHDLTHFGIKSSLENFVDRINQIGTIKIHLKTNNYNILLDQEKELQLFRAVNELINNTLKYADAQNINISLSNKKNEVILKYTDDGNGFNYEKIMNSNKSGIGLDNIINRAKLAGGLATIKSMPGEGMTAEIIIKSKE